MPDPSVAAGPQAQRSSVTLDQGPPLPPDATKRATTPPMPTGGGSPQIMALQFTQQLIDAAKALGSVIPALNQPMQNLVMSIQQLVPQAMADMTQPPMPGGPGGMMPMPPPPPGGPPGAIPGAGPAAAG